MLGTTKSRVSVRKKTASAIAAGGIGIALLAGGCAAGGDDAAVTLEIWNPETDAASIAAFEEMVAGFEKANPGVEVELVNVPWGDIYTNWQTALEAGNAPDATIGSAAFAASFHEQGVLENLNDVVERIGGEEAWAPSAQSLVELSKDGDDYFALPYTNNAVLLWYNKEMLADAGLEPPTTWDELETAAAAMTKDDRYGILVPASKSMVTTQSLYSLILSNGGDVVDRANPDNVIFDAPASVEAIEFYGNLAQYSPPGAAGYDRPEAQAAMTTGKLGMFIYGSWMQAALEEAGPETVAQFGAVPVPGNAEESGSFMGGLSLFAFTGSEHPEETRDFLAWMLSPEAYVPYVVISPAQSIPVIQAVQESEAYLNNEKVMAQKDVVDAVRETLPHAWFFGLPNAHAGQWEGLNLIADAATGVIEEGLTAQDSATRVADEMRKSLG